MEKGSVTDADTHSLARDTNIKCRMLGIQDAYSIKDGSEPVLTDAGVYANGGMACIPGWVTRINLNSGTRDIGVIKLKGNRLSEIYIDSLVSVKMEDVDTSNCMHFTRSFANTFLETGDLCSLNLDRAYITRSMFNSCRFTGDRLDLTVSRFTEAYDLSHMFEACIGNHTKVRIAFSDAENLRFNSTADMFRYSKLKSVEMLDCCGRKGEACLMNTFEQCSIGELLLTGEIMEAEDPFIHADIGELKLWCRMKMSVMHKILRGLSVRKLDLSELKVDVDTERALYYDTRFYRYPDTIVMPKDEETRSTVKQAMKAWHIVNAG